MACASRAKIHAKVRSRTSPTHCEPGAKPAKPSAKPAKPGAKAGRQAAKAGREPGNAESRHGTRSHARLRESRFAAYLRSAARFTVWRANNGAPRESRFSP
jgi:hypothetical protein